MIFGSVDVTATSVDTHRDSYLLEQLTVVSVRRPLWVTGMMTSITLAAFGIGFFDLLFPGELAVLSTLSTTALLIGWQLGQLKLLSRDLRGSELSGAILGQYTDLNRLRREIAAAVSRQSSKVSA